MILVDREIIDEVKSGRIYIHPFYLDQLNTNSYNLRLDNKLTIYDDLVLDPRKPSKIRELEIPPDGLVLRPGTLYLGSTIEYTETHVHAPMVEGRSSIGRLGISVHATAGFGDVGFCGHWTLEISCIQPVRIYPNMEVCQIFYIHTNKAPLLKYNGRYAKDNRSAPCRLHKELILDKSRYQQWYDGELD